MNISRMTSKYIVTIIQLVSEGDEQKACFQDGGCLLRFLKCERINPIWPIINPNRVEFSHFCVSCVWVGQRHWKSVVYSFEYKGGHTPSYTSHTIIICTIYNMSGRVVSAYTHSSRRRELYIWYNAHANVVSGLWNMAVSTCVLFLRVEKIRSTRRKTLEAQKRYYENDLTWNVTHTDRICLISDYLQW